MGQTAQVWPLWPPYAFPSAIASLVKTQIIGCTLYRSKSTWPYDTLGAQDHILICALNTSVCQCWGPLCDDNAGSVGCLQPLSSSAVRTDVSTCTVLHCTDMCSTYSVQHTDTWQLSVWPCTGAIKMNQMRCSYAEDAIKLLDTKLRNACRIVATWTFG